MQSAPSDSTRSARSCSFSPNDNERAGYVPSAVYCCGAILHGDLVVIPYSMSDFASSFVTVPLAEILSTMPPPG